MAPLAKHSDRIISRNNAQGGANRSNFLNHSYCVAEAKQALKMKDPHKGSRFADLA